MLLCLHRKFSILKIGKFERSGVCQKERKKAFELEANKSRNFVGKIGMEPRERGDFTMKKWLTIIGILGLTGMVLSGCASMSFSKALELEEVEKAAIELIEEKGYTVAALGGKSEAYVLDQDHLAQGKYSLIWGIQDLNPEKYIGKLVETYEFLVEDHPLLLEWDDKGNRIKLWVLSVEGEIIGGYTFSDYDEIHYGDVYSLEGETLEKVTEMRFQAWRKDWEEKYQPSKQ